MQALSVCSLQGDCLGGFHFKYRLNCSYSFGANCSDSLSKPRVVFISRKSTKFSFRSSACCGSSKFKFQCGVFLNSSNRSCFRVSPSSTLVLDEEEETGNGFNKQDSISIDGLSTTNGGDANCVVSKDSDTVATEGNENPQIGSEERIDVRALAGSLQFAKTADDVEQVLGEMEELPLPVYSSMIRGFGLDKRLQSAMALFEWLKIKRNTTDGRIGPNLFIYNSLLGAMKQCKQFGEVENVMEAMVEEGVVPNIVTYNTLMAIYLEKDKPKKALTFLEDIHKKGLSPSPISYSTALLVYRRMEDAFGGLQFFVELREKYQKGEIGKDDGEDWEAELLKIEKFTTRICYQVMRRWLVKGDHLSTNVLKLLVDMDKAGLKPGREEHERLTWACTCEGHYIVAKELYKRIRETDSNISLSVCNHVIWLMGKAKKWWAALEVYEDLLDKGPKPNNLSYELVVSHFNILLTAASRRGIWKWGVRLLNKMEDKGLKPRSREWNAVLVACSKASETSAAVQIFRRMVEQGEKPTIISYGALLSALEKGKLYDEALQVWEHMVKVGIKPNLYAFTILASIYVGQGKFEMVDSIITEMAASGNDPTVVTYNAIISGCAHKGLGSTAFEWFNRMKDNNVTPNEITYEMLILGPARDAKPIVAHEMYLKALNDGLRLSSKAYDAVVLSAETFGATIDASSLGPRPPEKNKTIKPRKNLSEFCDLADVPRRSKPFDKGELYSRDTPEMQ